jgi:hypothetical protein
VVIWPDADASGGSLRDTLVRSLAGIARSIEIASVAPERGKVAA